MASRPQAGAAPLSQERLLELAQGIKAVFCDLDGTLLDAHHLMPACAVPAILEARACGVTFVPTTGRSAYAMRKVFGDAAHELDRDFIACNGMDVKCRGQVLVHEECARDVAQALFEYVVRDPRPLGLAVFGQAEPYVFDLEAQHVRKRIENLHEACVRRVSDGLAPGSICKFGVISYEGAQQVAADLARELGDRLIFSAVGDEWVDVSTPGHAKVEAVEMLCEEYGWDPDEVLVIGDSMNDMGMLRRFPNSICVANAMEPLKECCRFEIGSNVDNAVPALLVALAEARKGCLHS